MLAISLKCLYFPNCDILSAVEGRRCSYFWKGLLWSRELIEIGLRKRIGDGSSILAFKDKWIPRDSSFKVISPVTNANMRVSDLIDDHKIWNFDLLNENFCYEDVNIILSIPIPKYPSLDSWFWHYTKDGFYSVKSAYKLAIRDKFKDVGCSSNNSILLWKSIWKLNILSKHKIFLWKALTTFSQLHVILLREESIVTPCVLFANALQIWLNICCFSALGCIRSGEVWPRLLFVGVAI